jgi:hypothetical protein
MGHEIARPPGVEGHGEALSLASEDELGGLKARDARAVSPKKLAPASKMGPCAAPEQQPSC